MALSIYNKRRKGQIWYSDFIVSILIFMIALVIYFEYVNNLSKEEESDLEEMLISAKAVSNNLMSGGYPDDWNQSNFEIIGIVDNKRINESKIERFYNISHDSAKLKFGISENYYFYLQDKEGNRISIAGKDYTGKDPSNSIKLVKVDRITIYNSSLVKMVVQIWR